MNEISVFRPPDDLEKDLQDHDGINLDATTWHPDDPKHKLRKLEQEDDLSKVNTITFDSSGLGRDRRGPSHVTGFATNAQTKTVYKDEETSFERQLDCSHYIVRAPLTVLEGQEASLEKTFDHLSKAQDAIEGITEPVDYTGDIVIENREDSVLETPDDLARFEAFDGYEPLYSINVDEPYGEDLLQEAPADRVRNIKYTELTSEISEYLDATETILTEVN